MNIAGTLLSAAMAVMLTTGAAQADTIHSPEGTWVTNGGESKYAITLCGKRGDSLCARMVWADDSSLGRKLKTYVGKDTLIEMARTGNQRWYGKIDFQGNIARGTLDLTDANNIHIKACNGAVCQTVELIRVE